MGAAEAGATAARAATAFGAGVALADTGLEGAGFAGAVVFALAAGLDFATTFGLDDALGFAVDFLGVVLVVTGFLVDVGFRR